MFLQKQFYQIIAKPSTTASFFQHQTTHCLLPFPNRDAAALLFKLRQHHRLMLQVDFLPKKMAYHYLGRLQTTLSIFFFFCENVSNWSSQTRLAKSCLNLFFLRENENNRAITSGPSLQNEKSVAKQRHQSFTTFCLKIHAT